MIIKRVTFSVIILLSILISCCAIYKQSLFSWKPKVLLGLDLNGGSSVKFQADFDSLIEQEYRNLFKTKNIKIQSDNIDISEIVDDQPAAITENDNQYLGKEKYIIEKTQIKIRKDIVQYINNDLFDITQDEYYSILQLKRSYLEQMKKNVLRRAMSVIRNRIDSGNKECALYQEGQDNIVIEMPGVDSPEELKQMIGKTAKLSFVLVANHNSKETDEFDYHGKKVVLERDIIMDGKHLIRAEVSYESGMGISFELNTQGASLFSDITSNNIGRNLAILLDDQVLSVAQINSSIGASGMISGKFTYDEANNIALLMRSGSLPVKLDPIVEYKIGPTIGAEAINNGINAFTLSIILITLFMFYNYGYMGLLSVSMLLVNCIIVFALIIVTESALTLPGIAGLITTSGMSVDASILINERINEKKYEDYNMAIISGYKNAMPSILDSNITTLIGACVIYILSSGFIRGFAVTLSMGIITSMFTSISLSRTILGIFRNIEYRR